MIIVILLLPAVLPLLIFGISFQSIILSLSFLFAILICFRELLVLSKGSGGSALTHLGQKIDSLVKQAKHKLYAVDWYHSSGAGLISGAMTECLNDIASYISDQQHYLKDVFKADKAFIMLSTAQTNNKGSEGALLYKLYQPYFLHGLKDLLGIVAIEDYGFLGGELKADGITAIIAEGFEYDSNQRGILWLGYRGDKLPSNIQQQHLARYASELGKAITIMNEYAALQRDKNLVEQAVSEKNQFFSFISHDLRTPLNNIKAIVAYLKMAPEATADTTELLTQAARSCDMMADLVQDLLDFSRHQAGSLEAKKSQFDLRCMIVELANIFLPLVKERKLELRISDNLPAVLINADVGQIRRILVNLLSNSIKYTEKGLISVNLVFNKATCAAEVIVSDTGVGLSEDQQQKLFQPFTRFAGEGIQGAGLGLALSSVFAQLNGAALSVKSEVGMGSTFTLTLQEAELNNVVPLHSYRDSNQYSHLSKSGSILVIEDDYDSAVLIQRGLVAAGYSVNIVSSAQEATIKFTMHNPELIISDTSMYDTNGLEDVMALAKDNGVQVIVVSGIENEGQEEAMIRLGVIKFIKKPFDIEELILWVDRTFKARHQVLSQQNVRQQQGG